MASKKLDQYIDTGSLEEFARQILDRVEDASAILLRTVWLVFFVREGVYGPAGVNPDYR